MGTSPVLSDTQFATFLILMVVMLGLFLLAIAWSQLSRARTNRINEEGNLAFQRGFDRLIELMRQQQQSSFKPVEDGKSWAKTVISRATGFNQPIEMFLVPPESSEDPKYLRADDAQGNRFYISDVSPVTLRQLGPAFHWPWQTSRISRSAYHPLVPLPRGVKTFRMSVENIGATFDLEIADLWKKNVKQDLLMKEMWLYVLPPIKSGSS